MRKLREAARLLLGCSLRTAERLTSYARVNYKMDRDALIVALSKAGESQRDIAAKVGVSQSVVRDLMAEWKSPVAETTHVAAPAEPAEPELKLPQNPNAAAERWRASIAAQRQAAAQALKDEPKDEAVTDAIEGVFPLPAPGAWRHSGFWVAPPFPRRSLTLSASGFCPGCHLTPSVNFGDA